jgi:TPR repeat protein
MAGNIDPRSAPAEEETLRKSEEVTTLPGAASPPEPADSLSNIRRLAAEGDAEAQYNLGCIYDEGQGVPQDHAEAARWFRLAAE